ncbi:TonB-dependent receptor plug domain-containing protein [uncultured Algibacter sp.]|uniref:TonB-dependent receptor plug domain-containing protein n=1 Tax=uncultured Algibacter sp. TaxID=298659 RepID=UPI00262131C3|nr:TonB-dependent receptor plug domain-containing protein [uncultured Algibacter sp.]
MNRNLIISIILFVFFFNVGAVKAQTIKKEKQPLTTILKTLSETYNVSFSYVDSTVKNKTLTIPNKDLSLEELLEFLRSETHLEFELLDNKFVIIKGRKNNQNEFKIQNLEEIVVKNYLTTGITKLNDGSLTIKPKTFGILPGLIEPDVLQTIQAIPGVQSTDETVSNINVRGGTHDQNLFLWDGIKMYQSGHFFGLISAFNPYTTERINVFKNGSSAKYGDGISSIIDMRLPNEIDNKFDAGIGFNLINADGYIKMPLSNKTELQLSTRRSITDLINTLTYDQYFKRVFQDSDFSKGKKNMNFISQNETFYFYDIAAKFLYDISKKDKIRFHFLNINNHLNYDEQSTINNKNEALNSKLSQQNLAIGITYTKDWNNKLSTTAQVYISNYDLDATNYDVINNQRLIQENEVYDGTAKIDFNYKANNQFKINSGYQFTEVGISNLEDVNNPNFRSFVREVIRSHAAYAETGFLSNNAKTKLTLGGRLNYINKFDMFFAEPRLSFSQRFLNNFRFEVLGEFKSQTTTQIIDLQNDFLGIEKRRWILSNNHNSVVIKDNQTIHPIPVLKSKQLSAGLHFNKNKLLISAETYIKKVNGITTRSQGFQNQFQFINSLGSYEIKGADFLINKQFSDIVSSWISYSYNSNNYTFDDLNNGKKFPNNVDITHSLTFAGTYTHNNIKFAAGLNWHSGIPNTAPSTNDDANDNVITYAEPNSSRLDNYLRVDCSASYAFNLSETTKATFGASIWNLLNKNNIINKYYTLDENNKINPIENRSLGITPNISFRVHF